MKNLTWIIQAILFRGIMLQKYLKCWILRFNRKNRRQPLRKQMTDSLWQAYERNVTCWCFASIHNKECCAFNQGPQLLNDWSDHKAFFTQLEIIIVKGLTDRQMGIKRKPTLRHIKRFYTRQWAIFSQFPNTSNIQTGVFACYLD